MAATASATRSTGKVRWVRNHEHEHAVTKAWREMGAEFDGQVFYGYRGDVELLHAIVTRDNIGSAGLPDERWHISVSGNGRVPTWAEIAEAGHALRPGVVFVIGVPPKSWWINIHPDVLHLHETKDLRLVDQWRAERRGDVPS